MKQDFDVEEFVQEQGMLLVKGTNGETYVKIGGDFCSTTSQIIEDKLTMAYKAKMGEFPTRSKIKNYVRYLELLTRGQNDENELHLRIAQKGECFFYDLGDSVVKVSAENWEVLDDSPVFFKRFANMDVQRKPEKSELDINEVLDFANLKEDTAKILLLVYLVSCFIPEIAHPIPVFYGEKGAAKSTVLRLLKKLVDPAKQELFLISRNHNELIQCISHNYMPAFDNLDRLTNTTSDLLCCAVTGGALQKRKLYTDAEDVTVSMKACVMLNGVNLVVNKSDLLDRSILFEVKRIEEENRRTERDFWAIFEAKRPFILGAIFDILVKAMKYIKDEEPVPEKLPRMADFALWGYAIAEAAGIGGDVFLQAYRSNMNIVNEEVIANDQVASSVVKFMEKREEGWSGYATELLEELGNLEPKFVLPKMPNMLSKKLKEIASNLSATGIECAFVNDTNRNKNRIELKNRKTIPGTPGKLETVDKAESAKAKEVKDVPKAGGEKQRNKDAGDAGATGDKNENYLRRLWRLIR